MTNIEVQQIDTWHLAEDELYQEAQGIKEFVYRDFLRMGAGDEEARSFADPDDDEQLTAQMDRMMFPTPSTQYFKILDDGETAGYAKVGPRRVGDEAPFGGWVHVAAKAREFFQQPEDMPRGLHVLAVRQGLVKAALTKIYYDHIPKSQALHVSAHENDVELNDALAALGAPIDGPRAVIQLGNYAATYVRWRLPPHRGKHP